MKKKYANLIMMLIVIILILIISLAIYRPSNNLDEVTIRCIAENSTLYVSKTCGHCAQQKQILEDYFSFFTIIDCTDSPQECINAQIQYVPTWIINGEKYEHVLDFSELKEMTKC